METKLNIAKILKDKPVNTRLYSPIFGNCILGFPKDMIIIDKSGETRYFYDDGRFFVTGECLLFPSKEMQDWSKFAWKRGDILISNNGTVEVIFDCFDDSTYASFKGKHALKTIEGESEYIGDSDDDYGVFYTGNYLKESEAPAQTYIKTIEKKLGGKLNLETLEIEKQLEFKDGDIIVTDAVSSLCYSKCIFILKGDLNTSDSSANSYIFYNVQNNMIHFNVLDKDIRERNIHLATDSEKQQLFNALADGNKAWDAEKKQIVALKPEDKFKPFDKVLVKDNPYRSWKPAFFWKKEDTQDLYPYKTIGGKRYRYCEPYEGNEHLLDVKIWRARYDRR